MGTPPLQLIAIRQRYCLNFRPHLAQYTVRCFIAEQFRFSHHCDHPFAVTAHDQRVFPLGIKAGNGLGDGHITVTLRTPHLQIADAIGIKSFFCRRLNDQRHQLTAFTVDAHLTATEIHQQCVIQRLLGNTTAPGAGLVDLGTYQSHLITPIVSYIGSHRLIMHYLHGL